MTNLSCVGVVLDGGSDEVGQKSDALQVLLDEADEVVGLGRDVLGRRRDQLQKLLDLHGRRKSGEKSMKKSSVRILLPKIQILKANRFSVGRATN